MENRQLTYDEISLVADYFDGDSRSELDTSVTLGKHTFKNPAIPANMVCCISKDIALKLSEWGYFYVMHRFMPKEELKAFVQHANKIDMKVISISLGVQQEDKDFIKWLFDETDFRVDYITFDIAHGHCKKMKEILQYVCNQPMEWDKPSKQKPFLIAGNVMTKQAVKDLSSWGADAVKVGIGSGKACTTRLQTGFHSPTFSTVKECSKSDPHSVDDFSKLCTELCLELQEGKGIKHELAPTFSDRVSHPWAVIEYDRGFPRNESDGWIKLSRDNGVGMYVSLKSIEDEAERILGCNRVPIIADGGIRHPGDIAKAIVAGADMVMIGSMFTACVDSPAEDVLDKEEVDEHQKAHMNYIHHTRMSKEEIDEWYKRNYPKPKYKKYFGSASYHNGNKKNIEGTLVELECNGLTYREFLNELEQHLQSSISYAGGKKLEDLRLCDYNVL